MDDGETILVDLLFPGCPMGFLFKLKPSWQKIAPYDNKVTQHTRATVTHIWGPVIHRCTVHLKSTHIFCPQNTLLGTLMCVACHQFFALAVLLCKISEFDNTQIILLEKENCWTKASKVHPVLHLWWNLKAWWLPEVDCKLSGKIADPGCHHHLLHKSSSEQL